MHELSIAYSLVEIASQAADSMGVRRVDVVHLRLGALAGVVQDALLFGYEIAAKGTALEGSRLAIEELPVVVHCPRCQADRTLPGIQRFRCPVCDEPTGQIVQGRELEIVSLEYTEERTEEHTEGEPGREAGPAPTPEPTSESTPKSTEERAQA